VVESSCIMFYSTALLALHNNSLTGTIPSEIGTMTALSKSTCCVLPCRDDCGLILMYHLFDFTDKLYLHTNSLTGTVPSEIGTMTALSKSICCFVPCRDDCGRILMYHVLFNSFVGSPQQ
jgi:hypothetical protein